MRRADTRTLDANEAVADVAYRLSEVIAIYPITPASPMGEHADAWAADERPNVWGAFPQVIEMQSEGGAAGAVHGSLQAGALTTTFTASQGLLLMLPNLHKIAGELTPFCMHVAARTIATHALSIFGDHSDVMAARNTGMALLCSNNAQEAHDFAAIGHSVTLRSRIPVLHFFDGFRTSHEISKIVVLADEDLRQLIKEESITAFRSRALNPEQPTIRGSAQNPDVFFQSREAVEPFYAAFPKLLKEVFSEFAQLTGREYKLFDYIGVPDAMDVIVQMGSGAECTQETVEYLNAQDRKVGLIKVRLFRPFSLVDFLSVLPPNVKRLTILDRTKEAGSSGEPLFQEIASALVMALSAGKIANMPKLFSGRYGLGSKEFTPAMVKAIFENMTSPQAKLRFTVGIHDDISHSSLNYDPNFTIEHKGLTQCLFYGLGSDGTVSANKSSIKIIGEETSLFAQGHFEYDSKKSGSTTVSHLRFGPKPIHATYRITKADFIAIHDAEFFEKRDVLSAVKPGCTVLVNTASPPDTFFSSLPSPDRKKLIENNCRLFIINANAVAEQAGLGRRISTVMQVCFFRLAGVLPFEEAMEHIKNFILKTWGKRGSEVVRRNLAALHGALEALQEIPLPKEVGTERLRRTSIAANAPAFIQNVTQLLLEGRGDDLPVSAFPVDGSWPTGTSKFEKRALAPEIPVWQSDLCVQCNYCAMICPHAAIQTKVFDKTELAGAPENFLNVPVSFEDSLADKLFTVQIAPEDCTGCGLCIEVCPARDRKAPKRKALVAEPLALHREKQARHWEFFTHIQSANLASLPIDRRTAVLREPLFEFSGACAGCGETPYIRLLTQLFGDHLLIANATGCSSIYGGNLPTTPYTVNREGHGPAWANSLFEDNAEFGLGMRIALETREKSARWLLQQMADRLPQALLAKLNDSGNGHEWAALRRTALKELRDILLKDTSPQSQELLKQIDALAPKTVWLIGGDGWAYDIGYGGLDHVLASQKNINILVLDTEVYSNTGGQASKATPLGASAKFATAGKSSRKKDLGLLAMSYGHVYVAQVALQSHSKQTVQAFLEAASYPGPSLIIAHSPCIAHGYDLVKSPGQQKKAVASGMWPLYRFNPQNIDKGESALVLDSNAPAIDVAEYMENEARFKMVQLRSPERYNILLEAARDAIKQRRSLYEQLAQIHLPPERHHG